MEVKFNQSSHASQCDEKPIERKLGYIGMIQEIMQMDFSYFHCVISRCKWLDTFNQNNVKEGHDSGIICINSKKMLAEMKETYAF